MANKYKVFSDYDVRQMNFHFDVDGVKEVVPVKCIGSLEEEVEVRNTIKKCGGNIGKKRTRGTGSGTLKMTAHLPYEIALKAFDMNRKDLKPGVHAYGKKSVHPEFLITADVFDEDENEKLKAYPRCVASTGPVSKVTNGQEEVAEVELEIGFMPDEYDEGFYQTLVADLPEDSDVYASWMDAFTPALVHILTGDDAENGDQGTGETGKNEDEIVA